MSAPGVSVQIRALEEGRGGVLLAAPSGEPVRPDWLAGSLGHEGALAKDKLESPLVRLVRRQWVRRPEADAIFLPVDTRIVLARAQATDAQPPQVLVTLLDLTRVGADAQRDERLTRDTTLASERRYLARELHDAVAQRLATLIVHLECDLRDEVSGLERIRTYRDELREVLAAVRGVHQDLRWTPADSRSLITGVRQYVIPRLEQVRCRARVVTRGWPRRFSPDRAFHVLRLIQEATANVARHARASCAVIRMEGGANRAMVSVTDNGIGFDGDDTSASGTGLAGMRERAEIIGGTFNVLSTPGLGTTVSLVVPIHG